MSPAYDEASWRENRVRPGRMLDLFDDRVADMLNLRNTQSTKYQVIWLDSGPGFQSFNHHQLIVLKNFTFVRIR